MTFLKTQFDKLLMAALFVGTCALAYFGGANDKLVAFLLQSAGTALGCLLTLVTARRGVDPPLFPPVDPTSTVTKASSTVETVTKTEVPPPKEAAVP